MKSKAPKKEERAERPSFDNLCKRFLEMADAPNRTSAFKLHAMVAYASMAVAVQSHDTLAKMAEEILFRAIVLCDRIFGRDCHPDVFYGPFRDILATPNLGPVMRTALLNYVLGVRKNQENNAAYPFLVLLGKAPLSRGDTEKVEKLIVSGEFLELPESVQDHLLEMYSGYGTKI